jgi:uncharacterized protein YggE
MEMPSFHPMPVAMAAVQQKAVPTPIEAGNLDVTAQVTVVLQVE